MCAPRFRSATAINGWARSRVTLMGDAIHSMTPYRGIGANIPNGHLTLGRLVLFRIGGRWRFRLVRRVAPAPAADETF